jgi:hypothetical protein
MENCIHQRIFKLYKSRNGKTVCAKKLIGHAVAGRVSGSNTIAVGFSLCHRKDKYNKVGGHYKKTKRGHGKQMAIARAERWHRRHDPIMVPPSIFAEMQKFMKRCEKYYKDSHLPWVCAQGGEFDLEAADFHTVQT